MADRERVLALLHDLEEADAQKAALLEELDRLAREVEAVQTAAARLQDLDARLPAARESARGELAKAHYRLALAGSKLHQAEQAVRRASREGKRDAELFEIRARDHLAAAKRRKDEAIAALRALEEGAEAAENETRVVAKKARALSKELRRRSRLGRDAGAKPGRRLAEIAAWSETARAALFVAGGQVAAERDAVIRQVNELGSVALGEPLPSASTAVVAHRVERTLGTDAAES